jgi:1-pyrroline-5-carboxylate dehydrogenase
VILKREHSSIPNSYVMQGQKCSACSRLYISSSLWNSGFKDRLLEEVKKIKVGPMDDFSNFIGPVMFVVQSFISLWGYSFAF